jgi:chemotaxis protein MotA
MNTHVQKFDTRFASEERPYDRGIVIGASISFLLIVIGLIAGGKLSAAFNPMSWLIVLGGTFGATMVHYSWYDIRHGWECFRRALMTLDLHPRERISYLVNLAQAVRQDGLLLLEDEALRTYDPFLRLALELTVDGQSAPDIKRILETEMRASQDKAHRGSNIFQTMGTYAPALGLIGTIIGMMEMLGNMQQAANIGPAMAIALTTTLYGAILSNLLFLPIAGKLRNQIEEELLVKAITLEGILAIGRQENPALVEQKLQGFLPLIPSVQ